MTRDQELLQGWYAARAEARVQLEAFESGRMKFHTNGVNVSDRHIAALNQIIVSYEVLIGAFEVPHA
jgi:hypothetical protein